MAQHLNQEQDITVEDIDDGDDEMEEIGVKETKPAAVPDCRKICEKIESFSDSNVQLMDDDKKEEEQTIEDDDEDDEFTDSFFESINRPQMSGSFAWSRRKQNVNRKILVGDYQDRFKSHDQVAMRPAASYSRHFVKDIKQKEKMLGMEGTAQRSSSYADPLRTTYSGRNTLINGSSSLLLAKGTEDVWKNMRRLTSPGEEEDFVYTNCPNNPDQSSPSVVETPRDR